MAVLLVGSVGCPEPVERPPQKYRPGDDDRAGEEERREPGERGGGDALPGDGSPAFWVCNPLFYNTRDGCDCGCGIADPDCDGTGCAAPGCSAAGCAFCHLGAELDFDCADGPPPVGWSCSGYYYDDGLCDCGCTIADVDCAGGGCTGPDCQAEACAYCWGPVRQGACD